MLLTKRNILAQSTDYLFGKKVGFLPITKIYPFANMRYSILMKYVNKLRRTLGDETLSGQFVEGMVEKMTGKKLQQPLDTFKLEWDIDDPKQEEKQEAPKIEPRSTSAQTSPRRSPSRGHGRGGKGNVYKQKKRWTKRQSYKPKRTKRNYRKR